MNTEVSVVIGNGGMGRAVARRIGAGHRLLIADYKEDALEPVAEQLRDDGFEVITQSVDVTSRKSVAGLAHTAAELGRVTRLVHTAGVSPAQAPIPAILAVDVLGPALVLDEFTDVITAGGAGVVIASNAGHFYPGPLSPEDIHALSEFSAEDLADHALLSPDRYADGSIAYQFAKRAAQLRVKAVAAGAWGDRGVRLNSISPGVISTPMGRAELDGGDQGLVRGLIEASAIKRLGAAEEIAAAAEFLLSPSASFVTGTDLLVDGGAVAAITTGRFDPTAV
ncbi:SDR family oxidoreductase [Streptomyces sp. NPDC002928]|uniref:SDR family oxidoreductase n=1 Tax=Streptomyces sp. NPDC002928 TaxID=3154440 RepID=UPI0033B65ED5